MVGLSFGCRCKWQSFSAFIPGNQQLLHPVHPGLSRATVGHEETFSRGPPNILVVPLLGENFWIFILKMMHSDVLYISERQQEPPNVVGPRVAYPPTPPSRRAWVHPHQTSYSDPSTHSPLDQSISTSSCNLINLHQYYS